MGGGSASVHAGIPPPGADPPGPGTPTPGPGIPPEQTPLRSACWEIRSTSGWYALYWNAILLLMLLVYIAFRLQFEKIKNVAYPSNERDNHSTIYTRKNKNMYFLFPDFALPLYLFQHQIRNLLQAANKRIWSIFRKTTWDWCLLCCLWCSSLKYKQS